jgi:rubrerythrin
VLMGNLFCANEVIEMGIQILKNGRDYYTDIARLSKNDQLKDTFTWLSAEEGRHIKTFEVLLTDVEKCEPFEIYDGEYAAYIKSLIEGYNYTKVNQGKEIAKKAKDNGQAIDMAISYEKEAILFIHEMKNVVRERERETIADLIKKVQEHVTRLYRLRKCLTSADLQSCLI